MTILIDKATREILNIDTLERGIIMSLLLLRNAANAEGKDGAYFNSVRISTSVRQSGETYQANLNATAKIPYHSNLALLSGMNLIRNLKPLTTLTVTPSFRPLSPTPNAPLLPLEPAYVNNLERYLVWASKILAASLLPAIDRVKMSFFEEDPKEPSVSLEYSLPIDWKIYLLTNNLLEASKVTVSSYLNDLDFDAIPSASNLLGNQSLVGNLTPIKN